MAYDSATDTALAGQAYQRALAIAQQKRTSLNRGYGLNSDGSLDNTDEGHLGSIYQTGLAGEQGIEQGQNSDLSRGFAGTGGLAGKAQSRARISALDNQALSLRNATTDLGANTQESGLAGQDYQSNLGNIGSKSAFDLAQTLVANPLYGQAQAPAPTASPIPGVPPRIAGARVKALKANPRAAQLGRNNQF